MPKTSNQLQYTTAARKWLQTHEAWFPWAVVFVYTAIMTYLVFRYHRVGGFGVETDFYAELAQQAKGLLRGDFSMLLYGTKGPVYSIVLAGFYLFIREYFYAGLIINLVSASAFLVTGYYLVRKVFNQSTAVFFILAVMATFTFQNYTAQAGSDMLFMAFSALSLFFLFRNEKIISIVLSALFALLAFLTRYNGAFLLAGAFLFILFSRYPFRERLKRLGIWFGTFLIAGLPWFLVNWQVTGNPVNNGNFLNIAMEYFAMDRTDYNYDTWTSQVPSGIHSTLDIILYDPVHFINHTLLNVVRHYVEDIFQLMDFWLGIPAVLGMLMLPFAKPDRRKLLFFSFGVFCFLILTVVFYNERFSLFLLLFYYTVAAWPFTIDSFARPSGWVRYTGIALVAILLGGMTLYSTYSTYHTLSTQDSHIMDLKSLGLSLGSQNLNPHDKIVARVPHIAHYAGLTPQMFPDVKTPEELITFCRDNQIRYAAYTYVEYQARPDLRILWDHAQDFPGLFPVVSNRAGVVFRIE